MIYKGVLKVDAAMLATMNCKCDVYAYHTDSNGETLFDEEVTFKNGMRVAVQVVESEADFNEEYAPPAWTQGVLFTPEGQELSCTEVQDRLTGTYNLIDGDDLYVVIVDAT